MAETPMGGVGGSEPADVAGTANSPGFGAIVRRGATRGVSRATVARESRRAQQFAKFKLVELNLVPLVDTFVSIVCFSLTTATVGELTPVVAGVTLPVASVGANALQQITLGIGPQVTLAGKPVMSLREAAAAQSNVKGEPLIIPQLYTVLKAKSDSIRAEKNTAQDQSIDTPLAVQGDKTVRYDLLSRVMHTAQWAGFKNISLQVERAGGNEPARTQTASVK